MYKLRKKITESSNPINVAALSTEARYSAKDIYDFLLSIKELQGQKITAVENNDGSCEFAIGSIAYSLIPDTI